MAGAAAALRLRARRRALRRGKAPKLSKQNAPKAPPPKRVKKSRAPPQQSSQAPPQQSQAAPPATKKQKPLQLINAQLKLAKQAGGTPAVAERLRKTLLLELISRTSYTLCMLENTLGPSKPWTTNFALGRGIPQGQASFLKHGVAHWISIRPSVDGAE